MEWSDGRWATAEKNNDRTFRRDCQAKHRCLPPPSALDQTGSTGPQRQGSAMAIVLNHTIVPARDKLAAARFFADLFGLECGEPGFFAPVQVNEQLHLLFDTDTDFRTQHYAFHVSEAEFDAIFGRIRAAGLSYGSGPTTPENGEINHWGGGRGVYFRSPDGHLFELMTVAQ